MTATTTPLANAGGGGVTQATLSGISGLGNLIYIVTPAGQVPTGVQFSRNGMPISGATSSPYAQVAADIPALGAADIAITATYTGVTYQSTAFVNSNPATVPDTMSAPVLTAGANAVLVAFTAPSNGGSAILDYDYLDINGVHTVLTASGQSVAAAANALTTGTIRARNANGYGAYSPQSNSVTPTASAGTAPTVTSAAAIVGSPSQGTPVTITGATFAGTVDSVVRKIYVAGTTAPVFTGTTSQTYAPVAADSSKALTVVETATGAGSSVDSTSASKTVVGNVASTGTAALYTVDLLGYGNVGRAAMLDTARISMIARNKTAGLFQYARSANTNNNRSQPTSWTDLVAGNEIYVTADTAQYFFRAKPYATTAVTSSGLVATGTIAAHGLTTGRAMRIINAVPAGYNTADVVTITVVDANTIQWPTTTADLAAATTQAIVVDPNQSVEIENKGA